MENFAEVLNWARLFGGVPFVWNPSTQTLKPSKSLFQQFKFAFVVYGWLVFLGFETAICIHEGFVLGHRFYAYQRSFLLVIGGLAAGAALYAISVNEQEICVWLNKVFKMTRWFVGKI